LEKCGATVLEKEDLWMNDEMIYHMDCPQGRFEVSTNNCGSVFIMPESGETIIAYLRDALLQSGCFQQMSTDEIKER